MALVSPPLCDFGWKAPDFSLKGVDGNMYSLGDVRGPNGTLVAFICNHCPYVIAIIDRLVDEVNALKAHGINTIAIMPNDTDAYAADSFENMKRFSAKHEFTFPYMIDETQEVARAYDAVCTPDFFGFNTSDELHYRGRLDASKTDLVDGIERELFTAMVQISESGKGPSQQIASMGCSIKWREAS